MAESILHSGSFVDRNGDEITVTFFTKSTSNMTVNKNQLNFAYTSGSTDTIQVSGYTGSVSVSKPSWLSYTVSTSSGRKTYTFTTASANSTTSQKTGTITFTDNNGSVSVSAVQAAAVVSLAVNPNTLTFNSNGETKTTSITFSGSTGVPTYSNYPDWVSVSISGSTSPMTLSINAGPNTTGGNRSHTMYINYGGNREDLFLQQDSAHSVSVQPSSFTGQYEFPAAGGTQTLTISDIQGSFSMNYEGDGLTLVQTYVSETGSIRMYNVTYSANPVTAARTGVINVRDSAGVWVSIPTSQAASTAAFAVSPTSFEYAGSGATNTFTFTGVPSGGMGYDIPSGVDWVTVSNFSNASVDITAAASSLPTSRTTTVTFYDLDDNTNYVTVTVNQAAGVDSLTLSKSSISVGPAATHDGFTATWTAGTEPTATIVYVQGDPGWLSQSATVSGNQKVFTLAFTSNYDASSRTALVRVTNGLQTETVSISQSSGPSPAVLSVLPSAMDFNPLGELKKASVSNISGTLTYTKPSWITVGESGSGSQRLLGITAASNNTGVSRSGYVTLEDDSSTSVSIAVNQIEMQVLSVSPNSISYPYTLSTSNVTVTYPSEYGVTTSINYLDGSGWIDGVELVSTSGSVRTYCIDVSSNPSASAREAEVDFYGEYGGTDTVTVTQAAGVIPTLVLSPSSLVSDQSYGTEYVRVVSPSTGTIYTSTSANWVSVSRNTSSLVSYDFTVTVSDFDPSPITSDVTRSTDVVVTRGSSRGTFPVSQTAKVMVVSPTVFNFSAESQTSNLEFVSWTYNLNNGIMASTVPSWVTIGTPRLSGEKVYSSVTVASNTSTSARSAVITACDSKSGGVWSMTDFTINQAGTTPSGISVNTNSLDFPYTTNAQTLTVSGVPANGYSCSVSYSDPNITNWLSLTTTAFNIIVTANSQNNRPGSRYATLTVTNSSDPNDYVQVAIRQYGNPATLSVTPNAHTYPATLSTYQYTVIYSASGNITPIVTYEREEGEEEIDWLSVELASHEEGSETWIFDIDCGPNSGSVREAMVEFDGDGGGADEVVVTQLGQA